jgi:hypothetical protein
VFPPRQCCLGFLYAPCPADFTRSRLPACVPVSSRRAQVKVVEAERQREVYNSIVRQLDTIENKSLPDVAISSNMVGHWVLVFSFFFFR